MSVSFNSVTSNVVKDITKHSFKDMQVGGSFKTRGLFSGVSDDCLVWRLVETNLTRTELVFEVHYCDVFVGDYRVSPSQNNKVTPV